MQETTCWPEETAVKPNLHLLFDFLRKQLDYVTCGHSGFNNYAQTYV